MDRPRLTYCPAVHDDDENWPVKEFSSDENCPVGALPQKVYLKHDDHSLDKGPSLLKWL